MSGPDEYMRVLMAAQAEALTREVRISPYLHRPVSGNPYTAANEGGPTTRQAALLLGFTDADQAFLRSIGVKGGA